MNGPAAHTRERQYQHLVSFNLKQKFPDKKGQAGGRLIAISWWSNRQQATGCRTRSQNWVTQSQRDNI